MRVTIPHMALGNRAANSVMPKRTIAALHPEEHRRFFPEWHVIDVDAGIIMQLQHFAGAFGEIDLIPVEEMHPAQERDEEQRRRRSDQQDKYRFVETHVFNFAVYTFPCSSLSTYKGGELWRPVTHPA